MLIGKFVAIVGLAGDDDDLPRVEVQFGGGGAQGVDGALRGGRIGVESVEGFHSATSVDNGTNPNCSLSTVPGAGTPPWCCSPTLSSHMEMIGTNFVNSR